MRKRRIIICILLITVTVICTTVASQAMNNKLWFQMYEESTDSYLFPITPENNPEEWAEFLSLQEMLDVCQIPDDILKSMSTKGLIETCLNYPLFGNMFAYNSYLQGMEVLHQQFNGLSELSNRENAAEELLYYYTSINYDEVVTSNDPYFTLRVLFFDYYMSQDKVLLKLSAEERAQLLNNCRNVIELKTGRYSDIFSTHSTLYLASRIMAIDDSSFYNALLEHDAYESYSETARLYLDLDNFIYTKLMEREE